MKRNKASRMGRPPGSGLPPAQVRTCRIVLSLLPAERKKLERLAAKNDRPLSTYAYDLLSHSLKRQR